MAAQKLVDTLLHTGDSRKRDTLLNRAAAMPECLDLLLEKARTATGDTSAEALVASALAIAIAERRHNPRTGAAVWRVHAQVLRALGRHAEALPAFDSAAAHARQAGDLTLAAQVQIGRIDSLGWLGRYDEAITVGQQLIEELQAYGAEEDAAKVLVNIGNLYFRRDQYAEALSCYERAMQVLAHSADAAALARIQANCANILTHINRTAEAIVLYENARAIFDAQGLAQAAAMVDANIGYLHYVSGEHSAALAALMRARQIFTAHGQALETAKCDSDLADVYRALNLYPEALEHYEQAIQIFERLPVEYERARAEIGRAMVRMAVDQPEDAFASLECADTIFRAQKNRLQRAHVLLVHAYLLRSVGRTAEACAVADTAARVLSRKRLHGWAAEARFLLADVGREAGEDVRRRFHAVIRAARHEGRGWLECRAEHALGLYYRQRADTPRALRHFRAGVAVLEQARTLIAPEEMHVAFLRDKLRVYEDLVGTLLARARQQDIAEALECVERSKSRLLLERVQSTLSARHDTGTAIDLQAREKLAALRAELSRAYHHVHTFGDSEQRRAGLPQRADTLLSVEQAYRAALREVELADSTSNTGILGLTSVVPEDSLRAALRSEEILLEYYTVQGSICAFVLNADSVAVHRDLAPVAEVAHAARRLRYHMLKLSMTEDYSQRHAEPLQRATQEVLRRLYDLLLRPLEPQLRSERVILVPHSILHGVPFHAFFDGERYALDRWEFVYAPSASVWHAGVRRRAAHADRPAGRDLPARSLLMGVPSPGIERVAAEIEQLADLLPAPSVFSGTCATLEMFRAHARQSHWIHLATHALYRADNPLFSGLRFTDGWLLARDLYELTLDCEMATLSACSTGAASVEPGDELFGLLRGFLAAGARTVTASLWPVDDTATAALMFHFYTCLTRGCTKAAALREAQRDMRKSYPHPYHWAAFALFGER